MDCGGITVENRKPKVFVIMPFEDEFFDVYDMLKKEFQGEFEFSNAGEEDNQTNILADIIQPIFEADVIIADLTGLNPNVLYELGVAHALNKKTIIITQDDLSKLPFDLKSYRTKDYSIHFRKFAELIECLSKYLKGAISDEVIFSNPVKDFINLNKIEIDGFFAEDKVNVDIPQNEKGFLDFLADVEENTDELTNNIIGLSDGLNSLNDGVSKCLNEINRVNKSGGSGTASFVRKQTKKAAGYMDEYSATLNDYNKKHESLWNKIEKDTLGLIENEFATKDENKENLIKYLINLANMKKSIVGTVSSFTSMNDASLKNKGIERTLNQAINNMDQEINVYLDLLNKTISSIDKILQRSKFIVGEIDFENTTPGTEDEKNN